MSKLNCIEVICLVDSSNYVYAVILLILFIISHKMINCYHANDNVLDYLYMKLIGTSKFKGNSPVDPFCGCWDTRM